MIPFRPPRQDSFLIGVPRFHFDSPSCEYVDGTIWSWIYVSLRILIGSHKFKKCVSRTFMHALNSALFSVVAYRRYVKHDILLFPVDILFTLHVLHFFKTMQDVSLFKTTKDIQRYLPLHLRQSSASSSFLSSPIYPS